MSDVIPSNPNLGMDTAWPLSDVLAKLIEATEHLLDRHSCDVHGHEEFRTAANRGKEYLATLRAPAETNCDHTELLKKIPRVSTEFVAEVRELPRHELERRVLIQKDWLASYSQCLDGLDFRHIPGSGLESARDPRDIRRIVEALRPAEKTERKEAESPLTSVNCEHGIPRRFCTAVHGLDPFTPKERPKSDQPRVSAFDQTSPPLWGEQPEEGSES